MKSIPSDASIKPAITPAEIVEALEDIRDELVGDMPVAFVVPKIWALVGRVEEAADSLCAASMESLRDRLASSLPMISGGAPDDFEEVDPEFEADPESWPAWTDSHVWEPNDEGPTPLEVLAASAPTWEPSEQDWLDYADWCDGRLSEADHLVAHGCC